MLAELQKSLAERASLNLTRNRRLLDSPQAEQIIADGTHYLSFCSNDYLGLANRPELIAAMQQAAEESGVGSGASNLITGHHRYHDTLEKQLASFVNMPAALLFSTGYMANIGAISALMGRDDAIFADRLNHACLNDGAILSRAEFNRFAHNDVVQLERQLKKSTAKRKLIVADGVFSMDGDIAPLPNYLRLCEQYDAYLYVDDAHGFGVLGKHGEGSLKHFNMKSPRVIVMATLGKAAGVAGAFVAGEQVIIDYLIQHARSYVYSTPAPPPMSAALIQSIKLIAEGDDLRAKLRANIRYLQANLNLKNWQLMPSQTAIQPLIIGGNLSTINLAKYLQNQGILVPAIRPPTVPKDTARLRISLSSSHTIADIGKLIDALHGAEVALA